MAPVCLRAMTAEEHATVKTLAHSRTAAACLVERAQIIWRASRGETTADIAAHVQLDAETVRNPPLQCRRARRAQGQASLWAPVHVYARADRHCDCDRSHETSGARAAICRLDA